MEVDRTKGESLTCILGGGRQNYKLKPCGPWRTEEEGEGEGEEEDQENRELGACEVLAVSQLTGTTDRLH